MPSLCWLARHVFWALFILSLSCRPAACSVRSWQSSCINEGNGKVALEEGHGISTMLVDIIETSESIKISLHIASCCNCINRHSIPPHDSYTVLGLFTRLVKNYKR